MESNPMWTNEYDEKIMEGMPTCMNMSSPNTNTPISSTTTSGGALGEVQVDSTSLGTVIVTGTETETVVTGTETETETVVTVVEESKELSSTSTTSSSSSYFSYCSNSSKSISFPVICSCLTLHDFMFKSCLTNFCNPPRISLGLDFGVSKLYTLNYIMSPFLIGICGGTASGKTTVCQKIIKDLGQEDIPENERKVVCIAQDSFYRHLTENENREALLGKFNFDSPDALDFKLMSETVESILRGEKVKIPVYDFTTNSRKNGEFVTIYPADVVLFEGILVFHFKSILNAFHMKVFVDTDSDIRLSRRILRDVDERGRDFENVIKQYVLTVKPAFDEYCAPTKRYADIILPGNDNKWGITLIVQHIKELLLARNGQKRIENGGTPDQVTMSKTYMNGDSFKKARTNGIH